jgi:hypothetical protein
VITENSESDLNATSAARKLEVTTCEPELNAAAGIEDLRSAPEFGSELPSSQIGVQELRAKRAPHVTSWRQGRVLKFVRVLRHWD